MLHKLIYTKKLLHICRLVDTNQYERCINEIEDFKHMLWSCRYSVEIWKETERQINERFRTNLEIKYHNVSSVTSKAKRTASKVYVIDVNS